MDDLSGVHIPYEPRTRRQHKKTRTGCGICKRRKIKCDEGRPQCANCERHGVSCDFLQLRTIVAAALRTDGASPLRLARIQKQTRPPQTPTQEDGASEETFRSNSASTSSRSDIHSSIPDLFNDVEFAQITANESIHLELLHNFTTLTSQTLTGDPVLKNVWRVNVPKVGFSNPFVMRSIFALSALHMALFSNEKREPYLNIARSEHGIVLREIVSKLPQVTADDCSAMYIASVLTFFYAWAAPRQPGEQYLINRSGPADWIFLLKGVRSLSERWKTELCNGPFCPLFQLGIRRAEFLGAEHWPSVAWFSTIEHAQLTSLRRTIAVAARDAETAAIYQKSLDNLEVCFSIIFYNSNLPKSQANDATLMPVASTSNIYLWLCEIEDGFFNLLDEQDPLALVIFAHFCVLGKSISGYWWMQGWLSHPLQEIWDLLGEEHRLWIRWPIEEVGWLPKF